MGVVDSQDETAQEVVDSKKDDMQIRHEVNRCVMDGVEMLPCVRMKNLELSRMGIGGSFAICRSHEFFLPFLKIVAEQQGYVSRDSAFVRAGVDNAVGFVAFIGMRVDYLDGQNRTADAIAEHLERAVPYRHQ
ncbi:MAG: hypothetical protein NUW09_01655 [Deltaproteobacteria bacterium]|nr:hypothetical protein [Deltaproteobacteria bacterium]